MRSASTLVVLFEFQGMGLDGQSASQLVDPLRLSTLKQPEVCSLKYAPDASPCADVCNDIIMMIIIICRTMHVNVPMHMGCAQHISSCFGQLL